MDRASPGRADEVAGEPLLTGSRQRLETHEREVEKGRDGDGDVDGHPGEDSGPDRAPGHPSDGLQEYCGPDHERTVNMTHTDAYDDWHTGVEFDRETRTWKGFIKHNEMDKMHLTDQSFDDKGDAAVAASDLLTKARAGQLESA